MIEIVVTGYPKSGNTWLIWLLGTALNLVQQDMPGREVVNKWPDNFGNLYGTIRKQHRMKPNYISDNSIIIQMRRDPRDVFISALHYGKRQNIADTVQWLSETLAEAEQTTQVSYVEWVERLLWYEPDIFTVDYEKLHINPSKTLELCLRVTLVNHLELLEQAIINIPKAIEQCSFQNMQSKLGSHYCRKGDPHQWISEMSRIDGKFINELPGMSDYLQENYCANRKWYEALG